MLNISPISCNGSKYQIKRDSKIQPVTKVSNDNRNNNSNSSSFKEILEQEIEKQKIKKLKQEQD